MLKIINIFLYEVLLSLEPITAPVMPSIPSFVSSSFITGVSIGVVSFFTSIGIEVVFCVIGVL